MFKSLDKLAQVYLPDLFNKRSTISDNWRNSCTNQTLLKPRTNYLKGSFTYNGV